MPDFKILLVVVYHRYRPNHSLEKQFTTICYIYWCLLYLDNNFNWASLLTQKTEWIPTFGAIFDSKRFASPLVLFIVQFRFLTFLWVRSCYFYFRFSKAIVHLVKPNLSGGPQVGAKLEAMGAFSTEAITKSARTFGAKLKVWNVLKMMLSVLSCNSIPVPQHCCCGI